MNWKKIGFHANVPLENSVFVFVSYSYEKIFSLFWEHDKMVYFFIRMKIPRFIVFNGFILRNIFCRESSFQNRKIFWSSGSKWRSFVISNGKSKMMNVKTVTLFVLMYSEIVRLLFIIIKSSTQSNNSFTVFFLKYESDKIMKKIKEKNV